MIFKARERRLLERPGSERLDSPFQAQSQQGLHQDRQREYPGPERIRYVGPGGFLIIARTRRADAALSFVITPRVLIGGVHVVPQ